jgi:hypothetical protein
MSPSSPYSTGSILLRVMRSRSLVTAGMTERIRVFFLVVEVLPSLLSKIGLALKRYYGQ